MSVRRYNTIVLGLLKKEELEEKKKNTKSRFFTSRGEYVNLRYIAMLYTYSIGNQPSNTMVVFKMRDSVPSTRYSSVCNVLRQWRIWLIPTYRVYRLYDRVYRLYDAWTVMLPVYQYFSYIIHFVSSHAVISLPRNKKYKYCRIVYISDVRICYTKVKEPRKLIFHLQILISFA